ncbi:MAG TPA: U32 family peptidase C-terminal domain-containing protein, partial [Candidatus Atribacteria bacterium]|nr:U32 family peptidase C-terminal domain-containing protein [Candidatus Atribacteria bacterium]
YYAAVTVAAYRRELDRYFHDPKSYVNDGKSLEELSKASHRPFTTGFYFNRKSNNYTKHDSSNYIRSYDFVGLYLDYVEDRKLMLVEQRNSFSIGDKLEIMQPGEEFFTYEVKEMYDEEMNPVSIAPHAQQRIYLPIDKRLKEWTILRRRKAD